MDKVSSNTPLYPDKATAHSFGQFGFNVIRKNVGSEHRKVGSRSSRISGLSAKLIKGQSIDVSDAETGRVVEYTRKVIRVAERGNARSRQQVSTMLRDNAATRVLFESIVPKLSEDIPFDFKVSRVITISSSPVRTTLRLVFEDKKARGRITRTPRIGSTKITVDAAPKQGVQSMSSSARLEAESTVADASHSPEVGQRSLATVEGPVGAVELRRIGERLRIPVRGSSNTDHWTLGLSSLSIDKEAPLLLRVVRRPMNLDGVDIELAWRGNSPSEDLVAELVRSIEELRVELAVEAPDVKFTQIDPGRGSSG